jgi:hypothetical protein
MSLQSDLNLLPGAISELFAQASATGVLTLADRYGLMAAMLQDSLSEEEQRSIDRLLRAVHRGNLKLVNELSALP